MTLKDRCWDLQHRYDGYIHKLPEFTLELYFMILSFVFISTGLVLFFYCIVFSIPIGIVHLMSNPLFYLVMGMICLIIFLIEKMVVKNGVTE